MTYTDDTVVGAVTCEYTVTSMDDAGESGTTGPATITTKAQHPHPGRARPKRL